MSLRIVILREQLAEVRAAGREQRARVLRGVAFLRPGEAVAHVFFSRPPYVPAGSPSPCCFVLPAPMRPSTDVGEAVQLAGEAGLGEGGLVVLLDPIRDEQCRVVTMEAPDSPHEVLVVSPGADARQRNASILESDVLRKRHVAIVGVGSFGSAAAVELAKAGVEQFTLIDPDRLEAGNLCRHHCGMADLGRHKTRAVRDAILQKNPAAQVSTHEVDVNQHLDALESAARAADLLLCFTDENRSRFNCNAAALVAGRPAVFARATTRAAGGDVFVLRRGGPCLACLFSQDLAVGEDELSSARQADAARPAYAPAGASPPVQPGLAADIAPLVQMAVKLALLELMRPAKGVWARLADDLEAPFYIWANRRDGLYEGWQPMKFSFNRNSILRWYGVRVPRSPDCLACSLS